MTRSLLAAVLLLAWVVPTDAQSRRGLAVHGRKLRFQTIDVPGAEYTYATGINARGDVVGNFGPAYKERSFVLRHGVFETYGAPDPETAYTWTNGIAANGTSVGYYVTPGPCHGCPPWMSGEWQAFVRRGGRFESFVVPGAAYTSAAGTNARGDVVGEYMIDGKAYGYLRRSGRITPLDMSEDRADPASWSSATGINASGTIVGWYGNQNTSEFHGYVLREGRKTTIDAPDARATAALGINDRGEVVGYFQEFRKPLRGFVWRAGRLEVVDVPGATYTWCQGISDRGTIVGYYGTADGRTHGFVAYR